MQWDGAHSVGHDTLDSQHRAILAQCNTLADCIGDDGPESDLKFHATLVALRDQAREHFETEAALLTQCAYPALDAHHNERDEFDYLANDIITTENFEKIELQRFLALWWVGHIVGSGKQHRAYLETLPD